MLTIQAMKFTRLFRKSTNLKITAEDEDRFLENWATGMVECGPEDEAKFIEALGEYEKALDEGRVEVVKEE